MKLPLLASLLLASTTKVRASKECNACVLKGCTYCQNARSFNPSVCVCSGLTAGFFGGCDDFSFGSVPLNSTLDCNLNSNHSSLFVFFGAAMLLSCCYRLLFGTLRTNVVIVQRYGQTRQQGFKESLIQGNACEATGFPAGQSSYIHGNNHMSLLHNQEMTNHILASPNASEVCMAVDTGTPNINCDVTGMDMTSLAAASDNACS